jgi:hypothetical protein
VNLDKNYTYKKVKSTLIDGTVVESSTIYRIEDGAWISADKDNRDYQEYLKWLAEGNTPEPADE